MDLVSFTEEILNEKRHFLCNNITAATNYTNLKTEIQSKITRIKIVKVQIQHVRKQILLLCKQQTCLFAVNSLSYRVLAASTALIKKDTKISLNTLLK